MKTLNKMRFIPLLLTLSLAVMMAVPTMGTATPDPAAPIKVSIDEPLSTFAVLAHAGITDAGAASTITGDFGGNVGVFDNPGTYITDLTSESVSGTIYTMDGTGPIGNMKDPTTLDTAAEQLGADYTDAFGRTPTETFSAGDNQLGGQILTTGVYRFGHASTANLIGTLTLDAQNDPNAVFIFQATSDLITAANSQVKLINGARFCRVFWQVGSGATLGKSSIFVGHIFAYSSIVTNSYATVNGQLLAETGNVTLDHNTIINGLCADTSPVIPATLLVIKRVKGGTALAAAFSLHVKTSGGGDVAGSPQSGSETGTTYTLDPGAYVVSEDASAGYTASYTSSDTTSTGGSITLTAGETPTPTVTITNTYTPTIVSSGGGGGQSQSIYPPLIKVIKTPSPTALTGPGSVTYTYTVTNPGTVALSNVTVTDNKVSPVTYVSGDVNADKLLQPGETWIYTSKTNLDATTTDTATATGSANGLTATGVASATVVVTSPVVVTPVVTPPVVVTPTVASPVVTPPVVVTRTVTGGQIPKTSTPFSIPMYELLLIGAALTLFGAVGWRNRKRYE